MFFHKIDNMPPSKNVINELMNFYKAVAKGALKKCRSNVNLDKVQLVKKARAIWKKKHSVKKLTACEYLIVAKASFAGSLSRGSPSFPSGMKHDKTLKSVLGPNLERYEAALRKAVIRCGSFEKVMRQYDSKDCFAYMDPPYLDTAKVYKSGEEGITPEQIKKVILKMKGKVLLSYNWKPRIEKLFCKDKRFKCVTVALRHQFGQGTHWGSGQKPVKELLIANFPIKKVGKTKKRPFKRHVYR